MPTRFLNTLAIAIRRIVKGTAKGYFIMILKAMRKIGYTVECRMLDAQWLGVPQVRQRTIFIGVRNDLKQEPAFPKPMKYRFTLKDAFQDLPESNEDEARELIQRAEKGRDGKLATLLRKIPKNGLRIQNLSRINSGKGFAHMRLTHAKPAPTIIAALNLVYHPSYDRLLTISELKRIFSFPDDFKLSGSFNLQWERMGKSVPPLMMKSISETVRKEILDKCP